VRRPSYFRYARLGRLAKALFVGVALIVTLACSPCDNEVVSVQPSPDGRVKAVVFTRTCGATTPFVTEVSIVPANAGMPRGWANALTLEDDPENPVKRGADAIEVRLRWESDLRLSVLFPRAAKVGKRDSKVGVVEVVYGTF